MSGVDDKKVRERKRLIALVDPLMDRNLVAQRVREREREREVIERKKERHGDQSSDGAKVF